MGKLVILKERGGAALDYPVTASKEDSTEILKIILCFVGCFLSAAFFLLQVPVLQDRVI